MNRLVALSCVFVVVSLVSGGHPASAAISIDDFVTQMDAEAIGPVGTTAFFSGAAATAIGGERDIFVLKTGVGAANGVRFNVNPLGEELGRHSQNGSQRGSTQVTWDGFDGAAAVNFDGLGGIDLLATGNTALEMLVNFSDVGGPVSFTFWESGTAGGSFAQGSLAVPVISALDPPALLSLPFTSFALTGGGLNDIFGSVGAIQMTIDGTALAQTAWDMDVDFVRAAGGAVPEPTSLAAWAILAGLGVCVFRRRRQQRGVA